ncbi:MAG: hypothetical protein K9L88_00035 [Chromatiaceae bacterium]|nr:hypothetical protein [Chromatiaceae bacterium]
MHRVIGGSAPLLVEFKGRNAFKTNRSAVDNDGVTIANVRRAANESFGLRQGRDGEDQQREEKREKG